jgi:hypothetical protein
MILNLVTADNLLAVNIFVAYRSKNPDKRTKKRVEKELKKNDIDINQLKKWPFTNCQQA